MTNIDTLAKLDKALNEALRIVFREPVEGICGFEGLPIKDITFCAYRRQNRNRCEDCGYYYEEHPE